MGAVQADELFDVLSDAHERRASLSAVSGQGRRDLHLADVVVEGLVDRLTTSSRCQDGDGVAVGSPLRARNQSR